MPMIAILSAAVAFAAAAPSSEVGPDEYISVYESDAPDASLNAIAISEKYNRSMMYKGYYDPGVWKSDTGTPFAPKLLDGLLYDRVTGLSVPLDLAHRTSWTVDGYTCASTEYFPGRWLIRCTGRSRVSYMFESGRGITAFDHFCGDKKTCWFELKTKFGVFRNLAAPAKP